MSLSVQAHPNRSLAGTARRICESRGGKWSGTKGMACCPAHDDRTPSLGVSLGRQAMGRIAQDQIDQRVAVEIKFRVISLKAAIGQT